MKKCLYTLIAAIAAINFLCFPVLAQDQIQTTSVYVTSDIGLYIRTIPTTENNEPIISIPYGTELIKVANSLTDGWSIIKYEDENMIIN